MFPPAHTKEQFDRLRTINEARNAIAHDVMVKRRKDESFDRAAEITATVARVVIYIVRVYIAKYLLGIKNDFGVDKEQEIVLNFFQDGSFNGHRVFDESYDEFQERIDSNWLSEGKLAV